MTINHASGGPTAQLEVHTCCVAAASSDHRAPTRVMSASQLQTINVGGICESFACAAIRYPQAVFAHDEAIWIADSGSNRIICFAEGTESDQSQEWDNIQVAVDIGGRAGFVNGHIHSARFRQPSGVAVVTRAKSAWDKKAPRPLSGKS